MPNVKTLSYRRPRARTVSRKLHIEEWCRYPMINSFYFIETQLLIKVRYLKESYTADSIDLPFRNSFCLVGYRPRAALKTKGGKKREKRQKEKKKEEEEQRKEGKGRDEKRWFLTGGVPSRSALQQTHRASSPSFNACRFVSALSRGLDFAVISEKSCYTDCGGDRCPDRKLRGRCRSSPSSPIKISLRRDGRSLLARRWKSRSVNLSGAISPIMRLISESDWY